MSKSSNAGEGIGFGGVLFVVFMTLKLCHVINWSWWWVTAPIWIPLCILLVIIAVVGGVYLLTH